MTTLVLTLVGADKSGLVAQVADIVAEHGGNWERSELAELSGAFAGIVEVTVAAERVDELRGALSALDAILDVSVHAPAAASAPPAASALELTVMGNDRPGIVREITAVLRGHEVTIDRMTTRSGEAAMFGGRLFEATVLVRIPHGVDVGVVTADLERIAAEIQVDVTLGT